jgi:hypothetical protein
VVVGAQHIKIHLVCLHDLVVAQQQRVHLVVLQRARQVLLTGGDGNASTSRITHTSTQGFRVSPWSRAGGLTIHPHVIEMLPVLLTGGDGNVAASRITHTHAHRGSE